MQLWEADTWDGTDERIDENTCMGECVYNCYYYKTTVYYTIEPMEGYEYEGETEGSFSTQECVTCDPVTMTFEFTEVEEEESVEEEPECPPCDSCCPDCPEPEPYPEPEPCPECPEPEPCPPCNCPEPKECPDCEEATCFINSLIKE